MLPISLLNSLFLHLKINHKITAPNFEIFCNRTHNVNNIADFHLNCKSIREPFVDIELSKDNVFEPWA